MKSKIYIIMFAITATLMSCQQSDPPVVELDLVWADEFDGAALDSTKWDVQLGDGSDYGLWRWGNNEAQYYRAENVSVSGGKLRIMTQRETFAGYDYTSARIRTVGSADIKHGRIEAAIKMPAVGGLWHAFWMLPSFPSSAWPVSGEMDIMEHVGNTPGSILQTLHFADRFGNHAQLGSEHIMASTLDFHQYALEWDENKIKWYIDDQEVFSVLRTNSAIQATWPFDAEFHVLLNTAVGGNLGGTIDVQALQTPRFMEVDYVRIYQWN